MAENSLFFSNISLGERGGLSNGQLKLHSEGLLWRKSGGGKVMEIPKVDISSLCWLRVPKGYQLEVKKGNMKFKFNGFREQDLKNLNTFSSDVLGHAPENKEMAISGRNWGEAGFDGNMLKFSVGGQQAFEFAISDVAQAQTQGKHDVALELHLDDTAGALEKDALMELTFHLPPTNNCFPAETEEQTSADVFKAEIMSRAALTSTGDESVVDFEGVHILTPRGRFKVELHISFMRLQGQAVDFKIQYTSVVRIFVLPKANQPHTFVVVMLDPPIRKGQTFYPHLVMQFHMEEMKECELAMSSELLEKNYKDRLKPSYSGPSADVFSALLKGLSGAKVSRPGSFRSNSDGHAVRTSLKAEEGYLYPLEKSFFFLPKPALLITHEEIDSVEFERHGAGSSSVSSGYFDLLVRLKTEVEHQFRNIQRSEYHPLFNFFNAKHLKILNLADSTAQPAAAGRPAAGMDDDDDSDEEDEDYEGEAEADGEGAGEAVEAGGSGGSAGEADDSEDESLVNSDMVNNEEEEEEEEEDKEVESVPPKKKAAVMKPVEKAKPAAAAAAASAGTGKGKGKRKEVAGGDEEGETKKRKTKEKKKKDPNAPKRGMTAFMFFSQKNREPLRQTNPGLAFGDIGKRLGEQWRSLSAEEKLEYEDQAKVDKARYEAQKVFYNGSAAVAESESEE